jgi:phospholipid/cholesterol/gamma-HCH transport system permease protein
MSNFREMSFSRPGQGELVVHLAGRWTLADGLPSKEAIQSQVGADGSLLRVSFDTQALGDWDTALPTFLRGLLEQLKRDGIEVDQTGLPDGVQHLLALASAVPDRTIDSDMSDEPWLARIGLGALRWRDLATQEIGFVGEMTGAIGKLFYGKAQFRTSDLTLFIQQCGVEALPIITLVSFLVGLILAFMGAIQLEQFGAQIFIADLVALGMAREMGALMTAIIMAGRTGAAFAAQLGTMMVNEEIDALKTTGISPIEFLVLPRLLALMLMMPLLCLYSDFVGILGGAVVGVGVFDLGLGGYLQETRSSLALADFGAGLVRATIFGGIVAVSGCLRGMQCERSAAGVGAATTSAVVTSIIWIVVASGIINIVGHVLD